MKEQINLTEQEAIEAIKSHYPASNYIKEKRKMSDMLT